MNKAIQHYFNARIIDTKEIDNGWKETYLLTLSNGEKVIFRSYDDYADIFEREKFFYDSVNNKFEKICPKVFCVDGSCQYYGKAYQISEYIDGISLSDHLRTQENGEKKKLYFELGKLIAHINQIEIDKEHPSVSCRGLWEEYFTEELLKKQLNRIVQNGLISEKKVQLLCSQMKTLKAKNSLSLIHRDIRPDNIIYDNGKMFVIDAEYCEVGDPLDEIARMELEWNFNEMFDSVLEGYKSVLKADTDSVLYLFYKLEWLAELLDMHYNHNCMNSSTKKFLNEFNHILTKLLH